MYSLMITVAAVCLLFPTSISCDEGSCQCAVFPDSGVQKGEPLLSREPSVKFVCDQMGEQDCSGLCVAMAQMAKEKAPAVVCEAVKGHIKKLILSVFFKSCKGPEWKYTGLTGSNPICCKAGKPYSCEKNKE